MYICIHIYMHTYDNIHCIYIYTYIYIYIPCLISELTTYVQGRGDVSIGRPNALCRLPKGGTHPHTLPWAFVGPALGSLTALPWALVGPALGLLWALNLANISGNPL